MNNLVEEGGYEIFVRKAMTKIQSRHVSPKSSQLWVQFYASDKEDPIKYWYSQCKLCSCLLSTTWFIGVQRHADKVPQNQIMPDSVLDCAKGTGIDVSSSDDNDI